jgi:hypothetical membrane protein
VLKKLLLLGMVAPILFWAITIIAGLIHQNYNHFTMAVSELGAIGTASQTFMAIGTLIVGICSLLFSIGFYKASKKLHLNIIPALCSFAMFISFTWAAIFPAGNELHGILGPLPLFVMLGALLTTLIWYKKGKEFYTVRLFSFLAFIVMLLFVLRFNIYLQQHYEGLIQRTLWMGWSIWFFAIGYYIKL